MWGQSDAEAGTACKRLGAGKIIGVSAQTVEQAVLAETKWGGLPERGRLYSRPGRN